MRRKDCDKTQWTGNRRTRRRGWALFVAAIAVGRFGGPAADAGSVRVWSSAVVTNSEIRLGDVCALRGFSAEQTKTLKVAVVATAPEPGGARTLEQEPIRKALRAAGANMATTTVSGAAQCQVSRPAGTVQPGPHGDKSPMIVARADAVLAAGGPDGRGRPPATLRDTIVAFFDKELRRYDGRAEVTFDRTSEQVLSLSEPEYSFSIHRRGTSPLGLIAIRVDVSRGGTVVQTVPLVVLVSMIRKVVVAQRAINADATIASSDLSTTSLRFNRIDQIGLTRTERLIGQRAKRFITAGSMLDLTDVESVPLVLRGQLVSVESIAGGVKVMTTGKVSQDGRLGEVVKIRSTDNKRVSLDALVVGAGRVRVGGKPEATLNAVNLAEAGT